MIEKEREKAHVELVGREETQRGEEVGGRAGAHAEEDVVVALALRLDAHARLLEQIVRDVPAGNAELHGTAMKHSLYCTYCTVCVSSHSSFVSDFIDLIVSVHEYTLVNGTEQNMYESPVNVCVLYKQVGSSHQS